MTQKIFDRLLLGMSILCLLIILQINFFEIPLNWCNLDTINIEKTNNIIFNLATNIIAGYIFYLINIQLVNYFRGKKTRKLIDNYLIDIATQMKVGQLYLEKTYFSGKDFNKLIDSDFSSITTLKKDKTSFSYKQINTLGEENKISTAGLSEIDLFYEEMDMVSRNIQVIYSFPYISTIDYELMSVLHKIQSSFFYIGVRNIKYYDATYLNFDKHLFEHYKTFKELTNYVQPRKTT